MYKVYKVYKQNMLETEEPNYSSPLYNLLTFLLITRLDQPAIQYTYTYIVATTHAGSIAFRIMPTKQCLNTVTTLLDHFAVSFNHSYRSTNID